MMTAQQLLGSLQALKWDQAETALWIVHAELRRREASYEVARVNVSEALATMLAKIVADAVHHTQRLEPYRYVTSDLEDDGALVLDSTEKVDFTTKLLPKIEADAKPAVVRSINELYGASGYIIEAWAPSGDRVYAYKKAPEKWQATAKGKLFPAFFEGLELKPAAEAEIFRLSRQVDSFHCRGVSFILHKKNFETGLNFRAGMTRHAQEVTHQLAVTKVIANAEALLKGNENNLRTLRALAQVAQNPRFKDPDWITKVRQLNDAEGWGLAFQGPSLLVNDENLQLILTLLRDRRAKTYIFGEVIDADVAHVVAKRSGALDLWPGPAQGRG